MSIQMDNHARTQNIKELKSTQLGEGIKMGVRIMPGHLIRQQWEGGCCEEDES